MKKNMILICSILIFSFFFSCVVIKELLPQKATPSVHPDEIAVFPTEKLIPEEKTVMEYFYIKGYQEKHTPPLVQPTEKLKNFLMETHNSIDLNRSGIIRFYNPDDKNIKRIFIIIPGIFSGGATVSNLGEAIKRRNESSEVWIWERRSNLLEDRRIIVKALKDNNPVILENLIDMENRKLKQGSFYQPTTEDISFVGYWGVNVILNDLLEVVKEAGKKADEIVLCGYSLGVLYTTVFLAMDFDKSENIDPGYKYVDKVVLFDGPTMIEGYIKSESTYKNGVTMIPYNIIEGKDKLEGGKYYPCNGSVNRDMSMFFLVDLKSAIALMNPDGISYEPYKTGGKTLKINNLASFLVNFDDNYTNFKLFTSTFGKADAEHRGKFSYNRSVKITGLNKDKDHIGWIPFKETGEYEFNDYKEYLKAACEEKFNMAEWYQPTRILLDFGSIHQNDTSSGWQKKYFDVTENKNITLPFLCIGLSRGLSARIDNYIKYKEKINSNDFEIVMINSITHLDGDTISDRGGRPVLADVLYNWINDKKILKK